MKQPSTSLAASGNALALAIANPGALGTIDAYISSVNRLPVLSAERETELGRRLRDQEDLGAARELILSHLRLVVSVARQYLGYGLPHADLIQEGNVGLMKAVKRFDPERGVRLVSFAVHWIKAEIHEYIIRNWRLVKVATTKAQRKLFFNLRSMRPDGQTLDPEQVDHIARELNVRREDVSEMEVRLSGRDMSLENQDDDDDSYAPIAYLSDDGRQEPTRVLERAARDELQSTGLNTALEALDARSRRIVEARWLQDDGGATLHELAQEFGVSAERIRQIEAAALKKMRGNLAA
ncbi:RNA polymerase sigma factor RpoH [Achromobacter marplatensis]|jgi:RNA polymerase sigma-32 factor|uniref:RNA polymerase sigma factor RpoH n=2 Tax=Achromobacter marplatensis TaxID=470868 RepID=J4YRW8_9BURK|nr:RNA polymerase sigma factor RpoH [Achromobacter marplatensis]EJO31231.1 RNA polymerase factor sigma-32 [Achromobacter marplatensis]MDH2051718.1 RNA polymerase sigma factor RpoH [Achromobacter marplatensis]OWT66596.1 RNA polymerase sigma factor RpoH [Achromobacter marplatensis]RBP21571.1 RNA polymerase RpoH-like sigma 32 subunit [Achromobacter marplatensis]CAB3702539.1 RNA polymerase sigma factor RpoH [Achromobacter marplatensis]